jgi:hypothetical protein
MRNEKAAVFFLMALATTSNCLAAWLSPSAERSFESYVANLEARLARQHASPETYLAVLNTDAGQRNRSERQLTSDEVRVEAVNGGARQVGGALLHHWRAAAFVPGATPKDMLTLLRDFNHLSKRYAPEVVSSRTLKDNGETATLAVRFRELRVVTIVVDAEYEIEAKLSDNDRGYSVSRSTHVWQVDYPETPRERRRTTGQDDGFLWHLNSYWSFARARQGLQIECEAVSLTRDVPRGLGWLITPMIADFSRAALALTVKKTKNALTADFAQEEN